MERPYRNGRQSRGGPPRGRDLHSSVPAKRSAADIEEEAWVAGEDRFVLQQAKQRAYIRVREGRARPIDWFVIVARVLFDKPGTRLSLDDDDDLAGEDEEKVEIVDPEGVFASLRHEDLKKLKGEIDSFCDIERDPEARRYWTTMRTVCSHKLKSTGRNRSGAADAGPINVDTEVEQLLANKTEDELVKLEAQIREKLRRRDVVDVEYWENLLSNLLVLKDKAHLKTISAAVLGKRLERLQKQQAESAKALADKICSLFGSAKPELPPTAAAVSADPEPFLALSKEDKQFRLVQEENFLAQLSQERRHLRKLGYVPAKPQLDRDHTTQIEASRKRPRISGTTAPAAFAASADASANPALSRFALHTEQSNAANSLELAEYEKDLSRASAAGADGGGDGGGEDEELLVALDDEGAAAPEWASRYKPRKPRYFNRVVMGYEWNKYNQTHFDHDNPPPKVPQGYKFNIFYPDLIDKSRAPTYRIEREKDKTGVPESTDGSTATSSGALKTCLIRFISGPPYEDICFRIVDREWDYSAKRDRAFRSNFSEKGLLELHFQFKKIYYRK